MSSCAQATTYVTTVPTCSNDPPPPYNEGFDVSSINPPSYSELFNLTPVIASIFGTTRSLNFEFHYSDNCDYSFLIRDNAGRLLAKVYVRKIQTTVTDEHDREIFKFKKDDSDDLREENIHAFEMRDKNFVSNIIKVTENGRCMEIIHKYSDPKLTVISLKIGDYAVFRSNSLSNQLCDIHITQRFKPKECSGSITFHPDTKVSTLELLLCTASAIALKIVIKQEVERRQCLSIFGCVALAIVVLLMYLVYRFMKQGI